VRVAGEVLSLSDPDFALRTLNGREVSVHTTGSTAWHNLSGFGDLQAGMRVSVAGVLQGNGTINAQHVGAGPRPRFTIRGTVTGVGDHSLTVDTFAGRTVTVQWDAHTLCVIHARGDAAERNSACSRIQAGDRIAAGGERTGAATGVADWIRVRVPREPGTADGTRP